VKFKRSSGGAKIMKKRNVVIRRPSSQWRPQLKRKIKIQNQLNINAAGFINPVVIVAVFAAFSGLFYMYSINQSAVKGFQIRTIEKEIAQIEKENELLRIREAELKSLGVIEQFGKDSNMAETSEVIFLDEAAPLALNSPAKDIQER